MGMRLSHWAYRLSGTTSEAALSLPGDSPTSPLSRANHIMGVACNRVVISFPACARRPQRQRLCLCGSPGKGGDGRHRAPRRRQLCVLVRRGSHACQQNLAVPLMLWALSGVNHGKPRPVCMKALSVLSAYQTWMAVCVCQAHVPVQERQQAITM